MTITSTPNAPVAFTIDAATLTKALAAIKPAAASRGGSPILGCVHIAITDGQATLTATDLDLTLEATVGCETETAGETAIPHALLAKTIKGAKRCDIRIEASGDTAVVSFGASVLNLHTVSTENWPRLNAPTGRDVDLNLDAIADVLPAAGRDTSRPILASVLVDEGCYAATDSYRLFVLETPGETGDRILIPTPSAIVLAKYKGEAPATIGERDIRVRLVCDDTLTLFAQSRLVEGEYPPFDNLIPTQTNVGATFGPGFIDAVTSVAAMATDPATPVRIAPHDNGVSVSVTSQDVGNAEVVSPGECTVAVAFNPKYLISGLKGLTAHQMLSIDALKPALLTDEPSQFGEGSFRQRLLMPVRVS